MSEPVTCTSVSKGEMSIKLSGVSATDSVLEASRKTGLDLVHGDVNSHSLKCSIVFVSSKLVSDNHKTVEQR